MMDTSENLPPEAQKDMIDALTSDIGASLEVGSVYYVISTTWYSAWVDFVEGNGANPGPIDNRELIEQEYGGLKESGISEDEDYVLRHEKIWELLKSWYDTTDEISAKAVLNSKGETFVDLFPIHFQVYTPDASGTPKLGSKDFLMVARSEKVKSLFGLVREHLNLEKDSDKLQRIWVCQESPSEFVVVEEDVMDDDIRDILTGLGTWLVMLEVQVDGTWPCSSGNGQQADGEETVMRRRASSFIREAPEVGQRVDARLAGDKKWHEAIVMSVRDTGDDEDFLGGVIKGRYFITVHYLSFDSKHDAEFDCADEENIQPGYTRVADWRTQLRAGEDVEVHRSCISSSSSLSTNKGPWLTGNVKKFSRNGTTPPPAPPSGDMELEETSSKPNGVESKRKRNMFGYRSSSKNKDVHQSSRLEGRKVMVSVKTGSYISQRKEVWVDLDSEKIAQIGTHTAQKQSKYGYGPQGVQSAPEYSGVVGLRNLGNTCFMNSMLQCLSFTRPLSDYFIRGDYEVEINRKNPLGTGGKLAESYAALISDIWSDHYSVIAPTDFKQQLGRAFAQFQGYQQQDSHELFSLLLDGIHEDLNRIRKKPYTEAVEANGRPDSVVAEESWEVFKQRNDSIVVDEMMGLLRSHLTCPVCKEEAVKFDAFSSWSVPIPKKKTKPVSILLYSRGDGAMPKLVRFVCEVPPDGRMTEVVDWLSKETAIPSSNLCLVELAYNKRQTSRSFLYNPLDDRDPLSSSSSVRQTRSGSSYGGTTNQFRKFAEDEDMIAFELADCPSLPVPEKTSIVEIQFNAPDTDYRCFRIADFIQISKISNKELHSIIWRRCKFMFRDTYKLPPVFVEMFGNENDGSFVGQDGDVDMQETEPPYRVLNNLGDEIPFNDAKLKSSEYVRLKFTKSGYENLRFKPYDVQYSSFINTTWKERDEQYGLCEVELSKSAEKFTEQTEARKRGIDLYQCMEQFGQEEQLGENDEWFCPKCKDLVQAFKLMELWSAPDILCIHLKRFYYERSRFVRSWVDREKISDLVSFPMDGLDLSPYVKMNSRADPPIYDLYAVSNHIGGMGGGHYTAYIKHEESQKWFLMDDSRTSEASPERVVSEQAYVLFYKRRS